MLAPGVYTYTLTSVTDASGCSAQSLGNEIIVTVLDNYNLTSGTIGSAQTICYNTAPSPLTELTAPTGGTEAYTYQWQFSPDNASWTNIDGATLSGYSPPALSSSIYYRRTVSSGSAAPVNSNSVFISVSPSLTLAQLYGTRTINSNTSTNINVVVSGGTNPYTINYTRNGIAQTPISSYSSGTNISTGVLAPGVYTYTLTSVTDASGCSAQSLGNEIIVTVSNEPPPSTTSETLFSVEVPSAYGNDTRYELGTEFQILADGLISKTRLYSGIDEGGDHLVRLWMFNGSGYTLIAGPYTWNFSKGVEGWREFDLPSPIQVSANTTYILSITNSTDLYYSKRPYFNSVTVNENIRYLGGLYSTNLGSVPTSKYVSSSYFRDIVFTVSGNNSNLTSGTIGSAQTICYNTAPSPLTELTAPTGGTEAYTYQWQFSPDNASWTNIDGATLSGYSPPALSSSIYYRRTVSSGSAAPVNSNSVFISVSPSLTLAQLYGTRTINSNTSTNINVVVSGGTNPYTINYTRNGIAQTPISSYSSGTNISTGVLAPGVYTYTLTSVTDASGCSAQSLGNEIIVTVSNEPPPSTTSETLFSVEVPSAYGNDTRYELGTEFQILADGLISKTRLYSGIDEGGDHLVRLWMFNGSGYTLIAGPYTWNFSKGVEGWREFDLPSPIQVSANTTYILSITNSTDLYYSKRPYFNSVTVNENIRYLGGLYSTNLGSVPTSKYVSSSYFRDIVFTVSGNNSNLTSGTIGSAQTICYNTAPSPLTELTAPTGGTEAYTYQWQFSPDNASWTNIDGATLSGYSPPALSSSIYYRRTVSSGSAAPVNSNSVFISVSPSLTLAQLYGTRTINSNTSTNINVVVSGGTNPYTINYTRNGIAQTPISSYSSGTNISTGVLAPGVYTYTLTSVTDASGCSAQSLGNEIIVTVSNEPIVTINTNKAIIVVNSESSYYQDFVKYIEPYFQNFGIPYDIVDVKLETLPEFNQYAIIIFGHRNVFESEYPISQLELSISNGIGLYSFDPNLFNFTSAFNTLSSNRYIYNRTLNISNTTHYITKFHTPDIYSPKNNEITLRWEMNLNTNSSLVGGEELVTLGSPGQTIPLLEVSNYGNGKIVKWNSYDWVFDNLLGPVAGMDDLIWRGIVWAARKPFVMQGIPPFITMRVDDSDGIGGQVTDNFEWVKIGNEFGIIPWIGTFNNTIPFQYIPTLKSLLDNNLATASPHSFAASDFIYFNHENLSSFDAAANTRAAKDFYIQNGLKISKYIVPHFYEISSAALPEVQNMGVEFITIQMLPDNRYFGTEETPWINVAPYRLYNNGGASWNYPVYYAGSINLSGINFFNCATEIRDDGGYEWYPDSDIFNTSARGIRHLRRSLNSMVLSTLFTHEYFLDNISASSWREILYNITTSISEFNPEYTSIDYAIQYIRAKSNIRITNVIENQQNIEIEYSGNNDMETKCYLFTDDDNQINYKLINLPQTNGTKIVNVVK